MVNSMSPAENTGSSCYIEVVQLLAGRHDSCGIPLKSDAECDLGTVEFEVALRDSEMVDVPNTQVIRKASNTRCSIVW